MKLTYKINSQHCFSLKIVVKLFEGCSKDFSTKCISYDIFYNKFCVKNKIFKIKTESVF